MVKFTNEKQRKRDGYNMKESEMTKVCGFYLNDWHLTTMLLPQINKLMNKNEKVQTIFENGIKNNIEEIISKMNLKPETVKQILEINWNSNKICKFSEIKKQIEENTIDGQTVNIIISGSDKYIEIVNEIIEKVEKTVKGKQITIINCYESTENREIDKILDKHDYVLNTSGIKEKNEVFVNYKKKNELNLLG